MFCLLLLLLGCRGITATTAATKSRVGTPCELANKAPALAAFCWSASLPQLLGCSASRRHMDHCQQSRRTREPRYQTKSSSKQPCWRTGLFGQFSMPLRTRRGLLRGAFHEFLFITDAKLEMMSRGCTSVDRSVPLGWQCLTRSTFRERVSETSLSTCCFDQIAGACSSTIYCEFWSAISAALSDMGLQGVAWLVGCRDLIASGWTFLSA
jgi:hypothetical protein